MVKQPKQGKSRRVVWIFLVFLLLFVVGSTAGVFIFKNVLRPGQQQRVISILPFMDVFRWHPPEGYALPTPLPSTSEVSPEDLLSITLESPTLWAGETATGETQETGQPEETLFPTLIP